MLSYQHAFHAGNLADVHKHALLCWVLDYLTKKPKPLSYIETHAGRGLYDLAGPEAAKTGEAAQGITQFADKFESHPYGAALAALRVKFGDQSYPGSPLFAGQILRDDDSLTLAELHPQEHLALKGTVPFKRATIIKQDGFDMALSRSPPSPRRGLLLCDPSFEVKSDYNHIPDFFAKLHRRWPVGVLALWFPVLTDDRQLGMENALRDRFDGALCSKVQFPPARPGHGMIGSGLFVINPPYGLEEEARRVEAMFADHF